MAPPPDPSASRTSSRSVRLARRAQQGGRRAQQSGQSLLAVLARLVPLARRLLWGVKALAIASAVSVGVIVAVLLSHGVPSWWEGGALVVVVAIMVPAPIVLWLFHQALGEAVELPEWLRRSPEMMKSHGTELAGLVAEARRSPSAGAGSSRRGGFVGDSVRAARLLLSAHDDLPGYGAALRLASPLFLLAVVVAIFGAGFDIVLAASVVLLDVIVRLLA